jgi:CDP-diacylglycerol---glycerol-3-phosphate 3-phosphatidyltransferase
MVDRTQPGTAARGSLVLPRNVSDAMLWSLDQVGRALVTLGVSANAVSVCGMVLAAGAGVLLSLGFFGFAALAMILASLGDALDGLVARRSGSASPSGALLDSSVDRYEEFCLLGGLAVFFRDATPILVLTLLALAGSFMVSYGSAKAEALGVPVPPGRMRRAERAVCLCAGSAGTALCDPLAHRFLLPGWVGHAPIVLAVGLIAVGGNVSAIRRLRRLARETAEAHTGKRPPVEGSDRR